MGAEEIIKFKDETIAQLMQIKDKMKEKLDATKQENAILKEEIEKLKQEAAAPAPPAIPADAEENLILGKIEELFGIIVDKLDDILSAVESIPFLAPAQPPVQQPVEPQPVQQPIQPQPVQQPAQPQPVQQPAQPQSFQPQPAPAEQPSQADIASFRPKKPSDVLKAQEEQEVEEQPALVEEPAVHLRKPSDVLKTQQPFQGEAAPTQESAPQPEAPQQDIPQLTEYEGGEGEVGKIPEKIPEVGSQVITIPYPADGAIKCPKCGLQDFQEMPDKTKRPQYGIYPKKYYCRKCRTEWVFQT